MKSKSTFVWGVVIGTLCIGVCAIGSAQIGGVGQGARPGQRPPVGPWPTIVQLTAVQARARKHRVALASYGITDLRGLGKLTLAGNVMPTVGISTPASVLGASETVLRARKYVGSSNLSPLSGVSARRLSVLPAPSNKTTATNTIPINTAYWTATWIDIADNTNVVLKAPNKFLFIIANKITVGQNVTFTYERADDAQPAKPGKAPNGAPGPYPGGNDVGKVGPGGNGASGTPGTKGASFENMGGPEFEVWTMEMAGSPAFDANGQNGGQGGPGGDGGDGGRGQNGVDGTSSHGAGDGNDGGNGGRAGDGGPGGNGAPGGKVAIYAPQNVLTSFTSSYYIGTTGGAAGVGGPYGLPGQGGAPGHEGKKWGFGRTGSGGNAGQPGSPGNQGANGQAGQVMPNSQSLGAITPTDFLDAFSAPHVDNVSSDYPGNPLRAVEGNKVTVMGGGFLPTDVVALDGLNNTTVTVAATVVANNLLTFTLPKVLGGVRAVRVRRQDGTLSINKGSLYVLPKLSGTTPAQRITPGQVITITGSGFSQGNRVLLGWPGGNQDMSADDAGAPSVTFVSATTLKWKVVRPKAGLPASPSGEAVNLTVADASNTGQSNALPVVLDTYRMLVFGDSVVWGEGLQESDKFYSLVQNRVQQQLDGARCNALVYKDVVAHCGALLGYNDTRSGPGTEPVFGEVTTDYPTITKQARDFMSLPDAKFVDMIILDGGHNDLKASFYMDAKLTPQGRLDHANEIKQKINQYMYVDMKALLLEMASKFTGAKVVVTGYYQVVSNFSEVAPLFQLASILQWSGPITGATLPIVSANCMLVRTEANAKLKKAVDEVNQTLQSPRFFFADPSASQSNPGGFSPSTALYAPQTYLYKLDDPSEPQSVKDARRAATDAVGSGRANDGALGGVQYCYRASAAHPNRDGARAYARAILNVLGL